MFSGLQNLGRESVLPELCIRTCNVKSWLRIVRTPHTIHPFDTLQTHASSHHHLPLSLTYFGLKQTFSIPATNHIKMSSTGAPEETDTESDVEFEDVPLAAAPKSAPETDNNSTSSVHSVSFQTEPPLWVPMLSLPEQRAEPLRPGSTEETQLRGRLSTGIERINYRHMKSEMGMDGSETRASEKRFENFAQLAREVGSLVDSLWASATRKYMILFFTIFRFSLSSNIYFPSLSDFDEYMSS